MSQVSNSKGKDVGRKYTSFNLSSTFKGSKGETKSTTGQSTRHGLQSLGKIGQCRRVPQPANLPSLKKENLGNDPRINLVPSGSQGWGKKETQKQGDVRPTGPSVGPNKPTVSKVGETEVSLRPNAGVATAVKPPSSGLDSQGQTKATWVNKMQLQQQPPAGNSSYFQREFPKLGGVDGKGEDGKEKDHTEGGDQDVNHQAMGHPSFMNGQKWMDTTSGPMFVPLNFPAQFTGERPVFNGNQQHYPYPPYPIYPGPSGRGIPMPPYPYPYPYPGPGGKMPFDPAFLQRMAKPSFIGPPTSQAESRPSVIKDSDFKSLEVDKDDNGWAGAQEEVDYNAKLKFDESDDSDEDIPRKNSEGKKVCQDNKDEKDGSQKKQKPPEGWSGYPHGYPPHMQMPYGQQNWNRVQFPGYDPQRGPPGPHGYPFHPMYFMPPYGFPQNLPPQQKDKTENDQKQAEKSETPCVRNDDKKDLDRKAAAQAKLRSLEEKIRKREEGKLKSEEFSKKHDSDDAHSRSRVRNDSEASDSSRRSVKKEIPPRFQRQISVQQDVSEVNDQSESQHLRIMQRKDSLKSEDETCKENKKIDVFTEMSNKRERSGDRNAEHRSRQSSSSSLYQETVKSERQKRYSSSSDTHDKEKLSRQGSNTSEHSKEGERAELLHQKDELNGDSKKVDRDSDRSRSREKAELHEKKGKSDHRVKSTEMSRIDSQRFADLKLTKGQIKQSRLAKEEIEQAAIQEKQKEVPKKASAWSKIASGEDADTSNKPSEVGKSLLAIQQEEEEEENRKTQSVAEEKTFQHGQDRKVESYDKYRNNSSHENKFRSDGYVRNEKTRYLTDEKYEKKSEQRRGTFGERTDRKPPRDDNYKGCRFDDTRADSYSKDNRRRDKRDDDYQKSERRDNYRKEHKRAGHRKDERNFKKDEAQDEFKTDERRVDTGKNDRSDYAKKHERRDEQGVKKEDQKDTVKDDERDDKRASYKKENQKRYERRDRKYEKRSEDKRRDNERRDNDRKDDKRVREVNKKYDRKDTCEDKRYDKKRNDWNNRDYRQSDEYKKNLKARQAQKEKRELKKSEDEQQHVEKPNMSKGDTVIDSANDKVNKVEEVDTASVPVDKEEIVAVLSDGTECKQNNISNEVGEKTENVSKLKSFGVPPDKNEYTGLRSDKSDRHDDNYSCCGRESIKGRDRGRGHSSRSSHNQTSSRSQRPNSSSGYSRSYSSRSGEGKRRDDLEYETISSGDFSDSSDNNNEKTKPSRKEHKKSDHVKSWEADKPPRFQHKEERGGHRGRGRGTRGSDRGRGADRGRGRGRVRGFHSSQFSSRVGSSTAGKEFDGKNEDDSELFYSAEESTSPIGHEGENERYRNSYSQDRGKTRPRGAYKPGRGDRESRGSSRGSRGGKTTPFLLNRQQVGDKRTSKEEGSLSAADKTMYSSEVQIKSNLEEFNEHSPPKKSKPLAEKKRDITREFDLNNIASVVCIDDINTDFDQSNKSKEEDGFVIVTSKKHQKEIRDRQREEEKRKVLLEQKREAIAVSKLLKTARKESQKNAVYPKNKTSLSFTDALISSATVEQVPVSADTAALPPSHPLASNAAMAAIGAWEPAQSLMRTSQQNNSTSTTEQAKTSLASSANAWQRPLSLSAAPITSMPDPRAVGTGKPSSSHVILANKSSLVPTQLMPEAASPLVTPPALAPIGSSAMNKLPQGLPTELESSSVQGEEKKDDSTKDVRSDKNKGKEKSDVKREKSVNKRVIRDRPPRFQTNTRKDTDDRNHYEEPRKTSRQSSTDSKSGKRSADRQRKLDNVKSVNNVTKHEKKKSVEKRHSQDLDVVFVNEMSTAPQPAGRKSILSDADKVVGSNKPSLKPRSSGSYTAENEDNMVEVQMKETYQAPDKQISSEEEEQNAKDTARSVIKSLNDDEERSLETRSLPETPPLAVKIPEPTLSGPSSDPGRAPSPNVNKNLAPTLVHEMNEMNRRLFYARKAWDDTPTASSTPSTVVASMSSVGNVSLPVVADVSSAPVSPTKSESVATVCESLLKPTEEKVSVSGGTFANKRSEQQNVCKVKPQQQLSSGEVKPYHVSSHQGHLLSSQREQAHILPTQKEQVNVNLSQSSKFSPYVMPVGRQIQQNTLYMSDSVYGEHVRSQSNPALNFQSLNQVRSIDPSVSLHQDLLLNMYGNTPIQASQLAWQVVSTSNVRPSKSGAYQTHSQGSLFTSPVSVSNTPVIMQYGTNFLPQRTGGNLQRQTVGLMPVPQQQQQTPAGRVVIPTQQTVPQMRRDQQHYQNLHATTQTHLSTGQMSQAHLSGGQISQAHLTAGQMTLLLDPNTGMPQSQQITAQQRSDLMKHVHAKPFEPTPQTPPLMQSPPVVNHQSIPSLPQQHIMPTVFSQLSPGVTHLHSQNANGYSQPLLQQGQRQHNVQHLTQQTPLVASVRPRSVQAQVATSSPLPNTNQDRLSNMSAFDPNLAMLVNALALKTRPVAHGCSVIPVRPQSMNNQFAHHNIHHRSQQRNVMNTRSPNGQQSGTNGGPGPIQRPSQGQHTNALLPSAHLTKPPSFNSNAGANEVDFKKIQRQKMLEDTKRYFQENLTTVSKVERPKQEEKPVSTPTTNPNLSKHDKYILPDLPKDNPKKYDYKMGQRNAGSGNDRSRNQRRATSTGGDGAKEQKRNTSKS